MSPATMVLAVIAGVLLAFVAVAFPTTYRYHRRYMLAQSYSAAVIHAFEEFGKAIAQVSVTFADAARSFEELAAAMQAAESEPEPIRTWSAE